LYNNQAVFILYSGSASIAFINSVLPDLSRFVIKSKKAFLSLSFISKPAISFLELISVSNSLIASSLFLSVSILAFFCCSTN
jgi:hypothetical protein